MRVHARHQGQRHAAGRAGRIAQPDGLDALGQSRRQTPAVTGPTWLLAAPATFNGRAGCRIEHVRLLAAGAEHALAQVTHLALEVLDFGGQRRLTRSRLGQLVAMAQCDPAFAFDRALMLPAPVVDARSQVNILGVGDGDRRLASGHRVSRRRRPRLQRLDALICSGHRDRHGPQWCRSGTNVSSDSDVRSRGLTASPNIYTEPTPEAAKCLKSLQIKPPPPVLQLA